MRGLVCVCLYMFCVYDKEIKTETDRDTETVTEIETELFNMELCM